MQIAYFDEVKYQPDSQPYYWLGAIVANASQISKLEKAVSELSAECFNIATMSRETEFHACEIFHRKRNFKAWPDIGARLDVLKRLLRILDSVDVGKIEIRVEPGRMIKSDFEEMAFVFLVERVERYLRAVDSPGLLIGDRDNEKVSKKFAEMLSQCRADGTPYHFGTELKCLIDTVHFTDSHHSRMLQLADLYVWTLQLCHVADESKYPQSDLIRFVRKETSLLSSSRYKNWPTKDSWIKVKDA